MHSADKLLLTDHAATDRQALPGAHPHWRASGEVDWVPTWSRSRASLASGVGMTLARALA